MCVHWMNTFLLFVFALLKLLLAPKTVPGPTLAYSALSKKLVVS